MDQVEEIFEALKRFMLQKEKCHLELTREINLSELRIKQIHYLHIINDHEYLSFSSLAELLNVTKPSVTNIVNQLIRLDVVYKEQCHRDGRIFYVRLSEKGKKIVEFKTLELRRLAERINRALNPQETGLFIMLVKKIMP